MNELPHVTWKPQGPVQQIIPQLINSNLDSLWQDLRDWQGPQNQRFFPLTTPY